MKLLVTGGAGFIGSNFIHYILSTYPQYEIINYDKLTYAGNLDNLASVANNPRYRFVRGDITNTDLLMEVMRGVDAVVHFAAESHVDRSIDGADEFVRTNVIGTQTVLDVVRRLNIPRYHHISTDEVFGSLGPTGYFDESTPYDPRSPYAASKAASDHMVRAAFETHKLPVTISNCTNNYGPYMFPEKVMPLFITNLMQGKKVPLYGDGMNIRDWIHVTDHNRAVDMILHHGKIGETYCIGAQNEKTNLELTHLILKLMGQPESMIQPVEDRKGHDRRYAIRPYKIMAELGWRPSIRFEDGLAQMIQWYKDNETWWRRVMSGEYREISE